MARTNPIYLTSIIVFFNIIEMDVELKLSKNERLGPMYYQLCW